MGLVAGGGLALGLSQLFGGWTKWGVPRVSSGVFLFGWIPTAVVVGWILLTMQPAGGWQQSRLEDWSDTIGILGFVNNFEAWLTAVPALILGLVTAFVFDTSGPRQSVDTNYDERRVVDEDVHDYRREDTDATTVRTGEPVATGTATSTRRRTRRPRRGRSRRDATLSACSEAGCAKRPASRLFPRARDRCSGRTTRSSGHGRRSRPAPGLRAGASPPSRAL